MSREEEDILEFGSLLSKLENRRVRIIYDSLYAVRSLLFYHILPYFSSEKRLFMVVYTDSMYRRLENTYYSISELEVKEILNKVNIIKIGQKENTSLGELYRFIPRSTPREDLDELKTTLEKLSDNDLVVFFGLFLVYAFDRSVICDLFNLFDALPEKITLFDLHLDGVYDDMANNIVTKLYDVILRIKKETEFFGEDAYLVGVEESILMDIPPSYERFKIVDSRFTKI